jgi:hypothetical protein
MSDPIIGLPGGATVDLVVCRRIAGIYLDGNPGLLRGVCSRCEHPIWVSPHSPTKPPRICDYCCADMVAKQRAAGDDVTFVSRSKAALEKGTQVIEALAYWRRN